MDNPYYDAIVEKIQNGNMKDSYTLFRSFEEMGQLTEKEIINLEKMFDDPSLSREFISSAVGKIIKQDQLNKLNEKQWKRLRIELNMGIFGDG